MHTSCWQRFRTVLHDQVASFVAALPRISAEALHKMPPVFLSREDFCRNGVKSGCLLLKIPNKVDIAVFEHIAAMSSWYSSK